MDTARLSNVMARPRFIVTRITRLHALVLKASGGRLRHSRTFAAGQPVLALTTTGRKSGKSRSTVLAYLSDGENLVIIPSNAGLAETPAWWLNLQADPKAQVDVAGEQHSVTARRATAEEENRLWPRVLEQYPGFQTYRDLTDRDIPLVILER
jgi:deazaflavin-dependent oxidoreductase (nitroreductase family)